MPKNISELQDKTFVQERGFKPSMVLSNEIWSLVRHHRWEHFCTIPKENDVIPLVQEFYAAIRDEETRRPHGVMCKIVMVRGMDVPFSSKKICKYYDAPYYDSYFLENIDLIGFQDIDTNSIAKYLTEYLGERNLRLDTGLPTNFNKAIMFPIAKMWMQFICSRITPVLNVSNVDTFRTIFIWHFTEEVDMHRAMDTSKCNGSNGRECVIVIFSEIRIVIWDTNLT
ncbi:hypothetical protein Golax_005294 [Gossypium laxum]|uniref:Putative plant transposon protein domain-containing protein n=1 Tax=Gossypium laxum TaxID=34288 RepID=A0A7J9A0M9_9ROSI|nr:hypothetical protein [Gossypium laxum]